VFFYNPDTSGQFSEIAYSLGLDFADDGRAFIPLDIDGDGDLDLPMASLQGLRLMENMLDAANFIRIRLKAKKSHPHALGAQVRVTANGRTQWDYVKSTAGFQTQVPLELHFGLAQTSTVDRVVVHWPSGDTQEFKNLAANRAYDLVEGETAKTRIIPSWKSANRPRTARPQDLSLTAPRIKGSARPLANSGQATVINFWAPWCAPCRKELPALNALTKRFPAINFVGISVETKKLDDVKKAIQELNLSYDQRLATNSLLESFFGADGEAPLPSTFVFDHRHQLRRVFYRAIEFGEVETLLKDISRRSADLQLVLELARHHQQKADYPSAIKVLRTAQRQHPDSIETLMLLGQSLGLDKKEEEALKIFDKALALKPNHARVWYARGTLLRGKDELAALAAFEKAVKHSPKNQQFLTALGAAYFRTKQMKKARKTFEQLVRAHPNSPQAWVNLAKAQHLSKSKGATESLKQALRIQADHSEAKALLKRFSN